jgi:hypothetical protein
MIHTAADIKSIESRIRKLRAAIGRESCPTREGRIGAAIERLKSRISGHWRDRAAYLASERLLRQIS